MSAWLVALLAACVMCGFCGVMAVVTANPDQSLGLMLFVFLLMFGAIMGGATLAFVMCQS